MTAGKREQRHREQIERATGGIVVVPPAGAVGVGIEPEQRGDNGRQCHSPQQRMQRREEHQDGPAQEHPMQNIGGRQRRQQAIHREPGEDPRQSRQLVHVAREIGIQVVLEESDVIPGIEEALAGEEPVTVEQQQYQRGARDDRSRDDDFS